MRYGILVLMACFCCAGGNSQEKQLKLDPNNATSMSGTFMVSPSTQTPILTCKNAGEDPEDYYDCEIKPGHTVTEVMRIMGRQLKNERDACNQLSRDLLRALPKPIEQHNKSKS